MKLLLICGLIGLVGGVVASAVGAFGLMSEPLLYGAVVLVAGGLGLWLSWRWWVSVDEGVREAHKASWFWGGSTALIPVGAVALALHSIARGDVAQYGVTPAEAGMMFTGITLTVTLLLIGYGLCWAGWWFSRSR